MEVAVGFVCIILFVVVVRNSQAHNEGDLIQLKKEKGLIGRFSILFDRMKRFAPDSRTIRNTITLVEEVGTLNGCKTYVSLRYFTILSPTILLTVSVITTSGARSKRSLFRSSVQSERLWDEIQIQAEKLADGL